MKRAFNFPENNVIWSMAFKQFALITEKVRDRRNKVDEDRNGRIVNWTEYPISRTIKVLDDDGSILCCCEVYRVPKRHGGGYVVEDRFFYWLGRAMTGWRRHLGYYGMK